MLSRGFLNILLPLRLRGGPGWGRSEIRVLQLDSLNQPHQERFEDKSLKPSPISGGGRFGSAKINNRQKPESKKEEFSQAYLPISKESWHCVGMGLWETIKTEWPVLKGAPLSFLGLTVVSLGAGFAAGMFFQSEQVTILNTKLSLRDDEIGNYRIRIDELDKRIATTIDAAARSNSTPQAGDSASSTTKTILKETDFKLSDQQLSSLEISLKANPSTVEIEKGGKAPKLLAEQIQGVFNISGWKVQLTEHPDTDRLFLILAPDKISARTITGAFEDSKVTFDSRESSNGGMLFFLDTNPH